MSSSSALVPDNSTLDSDYKPEEGFQFSDEDYEPRYGTVLTFLWFFNRGLANYTKQFWVFSPAILNY